MRVTIRLEFVIDPSLCFELCNHASNNFGPVRSFVCSVIQLLSFFLHVHLVGVLCLVRKIADDFIKTNFVSNIICI